MYKIVSLLFNEAWIGDNVFFLVDFELFYIFLLDFGLGAMIICIFLTSMGLYSTLNNSTPYEDRKNIKVSQKKTVLSSC